MASFAISFATSAVGYQTPAALAKPVVGARSGLRISLESLPGGASAESGFKPFDPLGIADMCPYGSMEYEWMRTAEIKHGRVCMAASVGWLINEAGIHFPGYISKSQGLTFEALGTGVKAWEAVPAAGKAQILAAAGVIE